MSSDQAGGAVPPDQQPMLADKGRDLDRTREVLERWLANKLGVSVVQIENFTYPVGAGASNETILFDASWPERDSTVHRELVLRVEPTVHQLFPNPAFAEQFDLLRVLQAEQLVKVPDVLWFEEDPAVLGGRFFLMSRLHGRVPVSMPVYNSGGWLYDATPAERRTLWESALEELARIHTVPLQHVAFLDRPELGVSGLEQELEYWRQAISFSTGDAPPDWLLETYEWLESNLPTDRSDGLSWGDARIGNVMFADDFTVAGVMDWEQASLSGGLRDLGWWLFFDEAHSTEQGLTRLDGLGNRTETIDLWQETVGTTVVDLEWYEVLTGFEVMQLTLRSSVLRGAPMPGYQSDEKNPFRRRLMQLLGK